MYIKTFRYFSHDGKGQLRDDVKFEIAKLYNFLEFQELYRL